MSLEFAEFAHFYDGSLLSDEQQREDFEIHACFLESLVRYFWEREPASNSLGISFDNDAMTRLNQLDSDHTLQTRFNDAASENAGRKSSP